jgi:hypothetical protein
MTSQPLDLDAIDEEEARTARLLRLSVDQIAHYSFESICDWLIARNEQHCAQLRAACQSLRAASAQRQRAIENLRAAAPATARP